VTTSTESGRPRLTQAERSARTRSALLAAARQLFAEQGFAQTGREEIAERAGVTRGALYHHFASKTDVAEAVVEEMEAELVDRVVAAALAGTGAFDQLQRSCRAYIDACTEPAIARILLIDAPAVLGAAKCRAISAGSCVRLLDLALANSAGEGIDVPGDPEVAAFLLLGMLNEAATLVASAPDPAAAREQVSATVDVFLSRLLGVAGSAGGGRLT
jgi:AcrR family transcriptional regulator